MAFGALLSQLLKDKNIGKRVVPIIPDEARTFGIEGLFAQCGIYSSKGQVYDPVDSGTIMYYKEAKNGQILEEGINEAGAMSSFVAAGTAYSNLGIHMIPFYIYYSMFGFQRVGDLIWLAADARTRGFLIGGTSGRTTLNGEGLQHQDGHSLLMRHVCPHGPRLRPGLRLRSDGHHSGRPAADVPRKRGRVLLHQRLQRKLRDARDAGRLRGGHPEGHLQAAVQDANEQRPQRRRRTRRGRNSSAADRCSTKRAAPRRSSPSGSASAATSGA